MDPADEPTFGERLRLFFGNHLFLTWLCGLALVPAAIGKTSHHVLIGVFGILLAETFVSMMTQVDRFVPSLIAKRPLFRLLASSAFLGLLAWASWLAWKSGGWNETRPFDQEFPIGYGFVLSGLIIGAVFRHCTVRLAFQVVRSRARLIGHLGVVFVWVLALCMVPTVFPHARYAPLYVLGLILGILLHAATRQRVRRRARGRRMVRNLRAVLGSNRILSADEAEALGLLHDSRYTRLLAWLEKKEEDLKSPDQKLPVTLRAIRCAALRFLGHYNDAAAEAEKGLAQCETIIASDDPDTKEQAETMRLHLRLMSLLNRTESADDDEEDVRRLVYELKHDSRSANCPATSATLAVREAELAFAEPALFQRTDKQLFAVNAALRSSAMKRHQPIDPLSAKVWIELGVPITSTFMKDAAGCSLLADGLAAEAKLYFASCIEDDPEYSAAYLHLGYLYRLVAAGKMGPPAEARLEWHARLCFRTAELLEGSRRSRVRRLARQQLHAMETPVVRVSPPRLQKSTAGTVAAKH